jgi:RsiW-degrading membrane proteinase PrsW (M82 family)
LIGAFLLFIALTPVGHDHPWLASLVFLALPALFVLMSKFEN